ncbi:MULTISPECIES: TadE/TadG family type IV pilus assembly protein [Roseobacteraceae]|uniref:TadE-like protein n=1 Tax=Pseudosulfitobacter pseudonitzschiae TaxID=1402135 RepID=A0A221K7S7_9RHOB|nr:MULTISPECIES: TadE/TadG family type IV pilus assembly protein [Roseobacteraceae]ASM74930.1 TadE-like protein [Pseudosulfitobacter pseudonitzschiae]
MKRTARHFLKGEDGATAVEFVLVLPILLSMVFGIICFGQYFAIANSLQQLAAEAARYSAIGITTTERENLANAFITNAGARFTFLGQDKMARTITTFSGTDPDGIQVSLSYDLQGSAVDVASGFLGLELTTLTRSSYLAY